MRGRLIAAELTQVWCITDEVYNRIRRFIIADKASEVK